ncbi:ABC transporter permease [Streptomyces sp. BSE7F]|uniref:ABC transporter permease n=1 Tax=unclassified Streptomyces TaxID=2593676 RepID=UPI000C88A777|nr:MULTISPECIES: ABC transporter permease [unclassified Streptomyces]MBJ6645234.1 ABC transporter permease [Streptomyces sp. BSE7-9]MCA2199222.1 ABC transporter permease [Streptomyces sp. SMS_SU21]NEA91469.1 ABC transporter permease [Actinospica acidiphila]PWE08194.1 ABC transporter permease [Streptomyces sp. BSE7F]
MTTTTHPYTVTPARVLRSEWHKLTTLRSTWICLGLTVVLTLGTGLLIAASYEGGGGDDDIDTVFMVLLGMQFTYVVLGTLGVLTTAGEHSTGQIRATMTAVPGRLPVLWSKAAGLAGVGFLTVLTANFVTFPLAQIFLADTAHSASLTDPGVARALVTNAAGLALLGVLALALGSMLRSVPAGIGALIGLTMILPELLPLIPYDVVDDAARHFPSKAVEALTHATPRPGMPSPGTALLSMTLWTAGSLALAALLLRRRDV